MICITIDSEQWTSSLIRGIKSRYNNTTELSYKGNKILLDIFDKYNVKATFFITGFFAEKEKEQVKEIYKRGHEIASHGYEHIYKNNPNLNVEEDIKRSKSVLEKIIKKKVIGFRSPSMQFSLEKLRILEKLNFKYDSSMHPSSFPSYHYKKYYSIKPFFPDQSINIKEFPVAVMPYVNLPIGWLWMRNIGSWWTNLGCKLLLKKGITPIIYLHPWEFVKIDVRGLPFYIKRNTGEKFIKILKKFLMSNKNESFIRIKDMLEH